MYSITRFCNCMRITRHSGIRSDIHVDYTIFTTNQKIRECEYALVGCYICNKQFVNFGANVRGQFVINEDCCNKYIEIDFVKICLICFEYLKKCYFDYVLILANIMKFCVKNRIRLKRNNIQKRISVCFPSWEFTKIKPLIMNLDLNKDVNGYIMKLYLSLFNSKYYNINKIQNWIYNMIDIMYCIDRFTTKQLYIDTDKYVEYDILKWDHYYPMKEFGKYSTRRCICYICNKQKHYTMVYRRGLIRETDWSCCDKCFIYIRMCYNSYVAICTETIQTARQRGWSCYEDFITKQVGEYFALWELSTLELLIMKIDIINDVKQYIIYMYKKLFDKWMSMGIRVRNRPIWNICDINDPLFNIEQKQSSRYQ